jgi:CO dehydrogenase maturation factor
MRVAIAGKGGAGKTTLSATLARLAAQRGLEVLAVDADSNPNLAVALGARGDVPDVPSDIVIRRLDGVRLTVTAGEFRSAHTLPGPDGVRLAAMGSPDHADVGCLCAAHAGVSALLATIGDGDPGLTLLDLEASPEHLSRGTARHVDVLLLVAEPYYRSLETVRRLAALAGELPIPRIAVVANKLRSTQDREAVAAFCERSGLELLVEVPWSDGVTEADRARSPLVEQRQDPVVAAVAVLLDRLARRAVGT